MSCKELLYGDYFEYYEKIRVGGRLRYYIFFLIGVVIQDYFSFLELLFKRCKVCLVVFETVVIWIFEGVGGFMKQIEDFLKERFIFYFLCFLRECIRWFFYYELQGRNLFFLV